MQIKSLNSVWSKWKEKPAAKLTYLLLLNLSFTRWFTELPFCRPLEFIIRKWYYGFEYLWFLEWQVVIWKHWIYVIVTVLPDMFWEYCKAETPSDCNKKTNSQIKVRCSLYRLVFCRWLVAFRSAIPEVSCFSVD